MENIVENNKLIAEFMGAKPNKGGEYELYGIIEGIEDGEHEQHFFFGSEMKFSTDWNWLRPVVKEIRDSTDFESIMGYFEGGYGNIIHTYTAVVEFIKWYNLKKKQ